MAEWGYTEFNGPSQWHKMYPEAAGERQSPVNVDTSKVSSDKSLEESPMWWKYNPVKTETITNPGYCWRVDVNGDDSELTGGPLHHKYRLEQFHCHWGCGSSKGSEHTVDGKAYAGELHLVHWNSDKYHTFGEAAGQPDGLAVLGVLLEAGDEDHPEFEKIVNAIPGIQYRGQKTRLDPIAPSKLLPPQYNYWTYLGSLTTPPCTESVTWILFKKTVQLSERQLKAFRSLKSIEEGTGCSCSPCDERGKVVNNYRPPLPLGERDLRECGSF
uniref:Carbonic anhydrase n=1 Tax=Cacopsylla melanoneura TaxID=428564 RepID=A0A8D9EPF5_9HEMI